MAKQQVSAYGALPPAILFCAFGAAFEPLFGTLSKRRQTKFIAENCIRTHTTESSKSRGMQYLSLSVTFLSCTH